MLSTKKGSQSRRTRRLRQKSHEHAIFRHTRRSQQQL